MSGYTPDRLTLRTAFEALRAGVPNRAAVLLLGSVEDAIEDQFDTALASVWDQMPLVYPGGQLFAGGFGAGKTHLLCYLREVALRQNFVVSAVSISKETPLSAPLAVFTAALRNTVVPGHTDDVMTVALAELARQPRALEAFENELMAPDSGLSPIFPALLHLLNRQMPPELLRGVETFLGGGKLPAQALRRALASAGAKGRFEFGSVPEPVLALQRQQFAPQLFRAAGFAGWCVLLDEVELIGRYSPLQRARAYAELARWLCLLPQSKPQPFSGHKAGVHVVGAVTDDFTSAVIEARCDREKLPERLRLKGATQAADMALAAIAAISAAPVLRPPGEADLQRYVDVLRQSYTKAYGWEAPPLPVGERRANRTMRHHVRGWITQWDILRLQGRATGVVFDSIASNYRETDALDDAPVATWVEP